MYFKRGSVCIVTSKIILKSVGGCSPVSPKGKKPTLGLVSLECQWPYQKNGLGESFPLINAYLKKAPYVWCSR